MISGHRRLLACKKLGLERIPSRVRNLTNDEAITSYIKSTCEGVKMEEPETGTHVSTLNINDGGQMNMIENSNIQKGDLALDNKETKQLEKK